MNATFLNITISENLKKKFRLASFYQITFSHLCSLDSTFSLEVNLITVSLLILIQKNFAVNIISILDSDSFSKVSL